MMNRFLFNSTIALASLLIASFAAAAGGVLTVIVEDEESQQSAITRMELWRGPMGGRTIPVRKLVPAGIGSVLDRTAELALPDGAYAFRMIRGPEYRIVTGTFSLEDTSIDDHVVRLPRMVNMIQRGWTSGDCFAIPTTSSLKLRMASEDLHFAHTTKPLVERPPPGREHDDPYFHEPIWTQSDLVHRDGLAFYGADFGDVEPAALPVERLAMIARGDSPGKVAIENPFAWQLPIWLASNRIDGFFLLGDWLRLDRRVVRVSNGRPPKNVGQGTGDPLRLGRWAETVYWNMLEAGFRIPPMAGTGSEAKTTPIGYNRLYVANQLPQFSSSSDLEALPVESPDQWWNAAWNGQSVATNGPMLRPKVNGMIPGHVFQGSSGETLELHPELTLATRDPVDYLEVVHNGRIHYSARLQEFAKANGRIPPIQATESGWVTVRVVTLHEEHFRAAMSAPWYIEFDGKPRCTAGSVQFFQDWQSDYEERLKRLPQDQIGKHAPFVRAARGFWNQRAKWAKPSR